jgi:hypothetical protein
MSVASDSSLAKNPRSELVMLLDGWRDGELMDDGLESLLAAGGVRYQFDDGEAAESFVVLLRVQNVRHACDEKLGVVVDLEQEILADSLFASVLDLEVGDGPDSLELAEGRLVAVYEAADRFEADLVASQLNGGGVATSVEGGSDGGLAGAVPVAMAWYVRVHEADLAMASEILGGAEPIVLADESTSLVTTGRLATIVFAIVLGMFFGLVGVGVAIVGLALAAAVVSARRS